MTFYLMIYLWFYAKPSDTNLFIYTSKDNLIQAYVNLTEYRQTQVKMYEVDFPCIHEISDRNNFWCVDEDPTPIIRRITLVPSEKYEVKISSKVENLNILEMGKRDE